MNDQNLPNHPPASIPVQMYRDFLQVMTEPRAFFQERYPQITISYALAYGVVMAWISAFLGWITRVVRHESLMDGLLHLRDQLQGLPLWKNLPADFWTQSPVASTVPSWIPEFFSVVMSPFQALFQMIFRGILLFIGAWLLIRRTEPRLVNDQVVPVPQDRLDLNHFMKIVAFTLSAHVLISILGFLPFGLNQLVGQIYIVALTLIAITVRYHVSGLRAVGIVFLPAILFTVFLSCIFGAFVALFFGGIASMLGVFH